MARHTDRPIDRGAGIDSIIAKATPVQSIEQQQRREREQARIAGTSPGSPPANQALGEVISLEKTDLWFAFSFIQLVLLVAIWMELRGA
jgi:3-hydroxyacyl-CoA dehydrogenase